MAGGVRTEDVVQWSDCPTLRKPSVQSPVPPKRSTFRALGRWRQGDQKFGLPQLYSKFEVSQGYMKLCLRNKINKINKIWNDIRECCCSWKMFKIIEIVSIFKSTLHVFYIYPLPLSKVWILIFHFMDETSRVWRA